jgi:hypothetical protein
VAAPTLWPMRWWLLVWMCLVPVTLSLTSSHVSASDLNTNSEAAADETDVEKSYIELLEKKAAEYRLASVNHVHTSEEEVGALYHLSHAKQLLADKGLYLNLWRSTRTAERGFERYPYSSVAGDTLLCALDGYLARGRLGDAYEKLLMIWFYLPDYPRTGEAMEKILTAVESQQQFMASVHLEREDPATVVAFVGHATLASSDKLLTFLSLHGDRETIAPRAELGLARSLLLGGTHDQILEARRSYEQFLEKYPAMDLTFTALLEHALSYLVGYRGDDYDNGALIYASAIVDQAELETSGDEAKAAQIRAYRDRIRHWEQDRDLSIARWYLSRSNPLTRWFIAPPGLTSWLDGARYYFTAVKERDSGSPQGHIAARELAKLPPAGPAR